MIHMLTLCNENNKILFDAAQPNVDAYLGFLLKVAYFHEGSSKYPLFSVSLHFFLQISIQPIKSQDLNSNFRLQPIAIYYRIEVY